MNQKQLVRAAQSGDHNAFRKLVDMLEARVAATVIGMLGPGLEAEDVGQETFIRLYRALPDFRGEASLETYVTRIAMNLSLNELKKRSRFLSLFNPDRDKTDIPDSSFTDSIDSSETSQMVQRAINTLKPHFRAVIVLRLIDGYSTRETAEILNLPEGTVLSRLARAQKELKNILTPLHGITS